MQYLIIVMSLCILLLSLFLTWSILKIRSLKEALKIRDELNEVTHSSDISEGYYDNVLQADISNDKLIGKNCEKLIEILGLHKNASFSECIDAILEKFVKEEYKQLYKEQFDCKNLLERFEQGEKKFTFEFEERANLKNYYWTKVTVCIYYSKVTKSVRIISYVKNIQEEKEREWQLIEQAHKDLLTGLLNKHTCESKIREILLAPRLRNEKYALLVIDIDKFKEINDIFGHIEGDKILKMVAQFLKNSFREKDIVGRIGGDEFMVLINGYGELKQVEGIVERILEGVRQLDSKTSSITNISLSVGIALFPEHSNDFEELFALADKALYKVKNNGRGNYKLFNKESSSLL